MWRKPVHGENHQPTTTKRKTGYGEEAGRIAFNILNRNSASPFPKKPGKDKDDKKDKDVKKGVGI
jgi:hypothetical protein